MTDWGAQHTAVASTNTGKVRDSGDMTEENADRGVLRLGVCEYCILILLAFKLLRDFYSTRRRCEGENIKRIPGGGVN
jgi:hypothetical protein